MILNRIGAVASIIGFLIILLVLPGSLIPHSKPPIFDFSYVVLGIQMFVWLLTRRVVTPLPNVSTLRWLIAAKAALSVIEFLWRMTSFRIGGFIWLLEIIVDVALGVYFFRLVQPGTRPLRLVGASQVLRAALLISLIFVEASAYPLMNSISIILSGITLFLFSFFFLFWDKSTRIQALNQSIDTAPT